MNWINLKNWVLYDFKFIEKKSNTLLKGEWVFNKLKDTAQGNSGDRILFQNRWTVSGASLRNILGNWAVSQELCDGILERRVDLEVRCQVIGVQMQMQSFNFSFVLQPGDLVLRHSDKLFSTVQ